MHLPHLPAGMAGQVMTTHNIEASMVTMTEKRGITIRTHIPDIITMMNSPILTYFIPSDHTAIFDRIWGIVGKYGATGSIREGEPKCARILF